MSVQSSAGNMGAGKDSVSSAVGGDSSLGSALGGPLGIGLSVGGNFLASYMQSKSEEERFNRQMKLQERQFEHTQAMNIASNTRAEEAHNSNELRADNIHNRQLRDDSQNQQFYLKSLQAMSGK